MKDKEDVQGSSGRSLSCHPDPSRFVTPFLIAWMVLLTVHAPCEGWWDSGHYAVAEIAYAHLKPQSKHEADRLIAVLGAHYPSSDTFVKAATWADQVGSEGRLQLFSRWHFINRIYDPEKRLSQFKKSLYEARYQDNHLIHGIKECERTLRNPRARDLEKAIMLRHLIHLVADIHQPLHCCELYSAEFPYGDRGGNRFRLSEISPDTLHKLWDSGMGALPKMDRRPSQRQWELLRKRCETLLADHQDCAQEVGVFSPDDWAEESYQLAISVAWCGTTQSMEAWSTPFASIQPSTAMAILRTALLKTGWPCMAMKCPSPSTDS